MKELIKLIIDEIMKINFGRIYMYFISKELGKIENTKIKAFFLDSSSVENILTRNPFPYFMFLIIVLIYAMKKRDDIKEAVPA